MKIDLTKKEYRLLLDIFYLSDWIMRSHEVNPELFYPEHRMLEKKILSSYKEMSAEDIIEYSDEFDDYYESCDYEDYLQATFIKPYDDQVFWEELIDRLAERDAVKQVGIEKFSALEGAERFRIINELCDRYSNEFEMHGLENITLDYRGIDLN